MTQKNDGGPAFPGFDPKSESPKPVDGMSLRDWFAGQALAGLASIDENADAPGFISNEAYRISDAMIAARSGGET